MAQQKNALVCRSAAPLVLPVEMSRNRCCTPCRLPGRRPEADPTCGCSMATVVLYLVSIAPSQDGPQTDLTEGRVRRGQKRVRKRHIRATRAQHHQQQQPGMRKRNHETSGAYEWMDEFGGKARRTLLGNVLDDKDSLGHLHELPIEGLGGVTHREEQWKARGKAR